MSPFEIGAMRPTGPVQGSNARTASAASAAPRTRTTETPDAGAAAQVERSAALDAGQSAPVDAERVKVMTGTPAIPLR